MPHIPPLAYAISKRKFDLVRVMIKECGASLDFPDENRMTPIMHAVRTVSVIQQYRGYIL